VSGLLARLFGVQPGAYRVLVGAFWQMSLRSPTSLIMQRNKKGGSSLWKAWLLYFFFGALVSVVAFSGVSRPLFATIVCGSALFLIGMAVMADFAVFVMAPGDDEVLFHRPIRSATYLAARLTVAGLHVSILAALYGFVPALTSLYYGQLLYPPLLLLALVATALFALLLAFGVYRLGLRWLGGRRLRHVMTYLPALFSILTFLVPQLLIGQMRGAAAAEVEPYLTVLPPAWFASIPEVLLGASGGEILLRAALGLLVLPVGYWILISAMGRGFLSDLLLQLNAQGESTTTQRPSRLLARERRPSTAPETRAGYLLYVGAMRSADSRTRTAPILLMPIAFLLLSVFRPAGAGIGTTFALYMLAAGAGTLVGMTVFHEAHAAAWFYGAVPIRRYGRFFLGVVQGLMFRHILPAFLLIVLVSLALNPSWLTLAGALHALAGGCLSIPFLASFQRTVPFSRAFQPSEQTAQMGLYFVSMMIVAVVGGAHALIAHFAPAAFFLTIPLFGLIFLVWMRAVVADLDAHPPEPVAAPALQRAQVKKRVSTGAPATGGQRSGFGSARRRGRRRG